MSENKLFVIVIVVVIVIILDIAQRFQKLIYLHLFPGCFMKISPQSLEQIHRMYLFQKDWGKIFMKQFVNESR